MISLRRRLLVGTGAGTVTVLIVAGASLYVLMRASLMREFDKALLEKTAALSDMIEQNAQKIVLEFAPNEEEEMLEFQQTDRPEYYQVWREDRTVVGKSPSLGRENLPRDVSPKELHISAISVRENFSARMATLQFTPQVDDENPPNIPPHPLTLAYARDTAEVQSSLGQLRMLLIVVGAAATLVSLGILGWLIRVGLKPVDELARRISLIDEGRLTARLDPRESPTELSSIITRLNELLGRLQAAFTREKTMTANVAHELRTPLAGIRSTIEVALSRERDAQAFRQVLWECLQICTQTQRLVESLLAMARLEAGTEAINRMRVDVGSLLRAAWAPFESLAGERKLKVHWEGGQDLYVDTDPEKLMIVLNNIFENAARYANEGGTIAIDAIRSNGRLEVRVSNTGSRISSDEVARVFEPFWRGDQARVATGTHSGLGLALSKMIVRRLGGKIEAESANGGSFTVTVEVAVVRGPS